MQNWAILENYGTYGYIFSIQIFIFTFFDHQSENFQVV